MTTETKAANKQEVKAFSLPQGSSNRKVRDEINFLITFGIEGPLYEEIENHKMLFETIIKFILKEKVGWGAGSGKLELSEIEH